MKRRLEHGREVGGPCSPILWRVYDPSEKLQEILLLTGLHAAYFAHSVESLYGVVDPETFFSTSTSTA